MHTTNRSIVQALTHAHEHVALLEQEGITVFTASGYRTGDVWIHLDGDDGLAEAVDVLWPINPPEIRLNNKSTASLYFAEGLVNDHRVRIAGMLTHAPSEVAA